MKQRQKNIIKMIKTSYKNKFELVTELFLNKKSRKKKKEYGKRILMTEK